VTVIEMLRVSLCFEQLNFLQKQGSGSYSSLSFEKTCSSTEATARGHQRELQAVVVVAVVYWSSVVSVASATSDSFAVTDVTGQ
jgi:hypothetical protein